MSNEVLWTNLNFLHNKIINEHKSKRSREVIAIDVCKEMRRLARSILNDDISLASFKVVKLTVGGNRPYNRFVDIRSTGGFTMRIDTNNAIAFKDWAFGEDSDKVSETVEMVRFDNSKPYYVTPVDKEKVLTDKPTGTVVDMETHRLNVKHGND